MKWSLSIFLFFALSVNAEVSHEHVSQMIDQMVEKNVISKVEAEKAKLRMLSMSPDQWSQINQQAATVAAARSPASVDEHSGNKISEVKEIDLESAQFRQIQSDMSKIIPKY